MLIKDTDINTNTELRDLQADWEVFRVQAIVCLGVLPVSSLVFASVAKQSPPSPPRR